MKKNSKILFLAHSHSIHTKRWIYYFVSKNWNVTVISFHPERIEGIRNIYLNVGEINTTGKNYNYLLKIFHIIYYVWKIKPDILCCHYLSSFGILGYLTFYKPLVITLYGSDLFLYSRKNIAYKFLSSLTLKKAALIISVSDAMTRYLASNYKITGQKIVTRQYGIDLNVFNCNSQSEIRKFTFITNRSFTENSNYSTILGVLEKIKVEIPAFKMLIVGAGPLKQLILERIKQSNLKENIVLVDAVDHNKMAEYLNDSLIYVSMTSSDGTPLSVFEAAACGAYPFLSDIEANTEWLNKGLIGRSVSLNNIDKIVDKLVDLLKNIHDLDYQLKNIEFVKKHMDYKKNMSLFEDQMRRLAVKR